MVILDTFALVRFFTKDDTSKALKVRKLIESNSSLYVPEVVFVELDYVLKGLVYGEGRDQILKAFQFLVGRNNIKVSRVTRDSLNLYQNTKLSFSDCLILSHAKKRKLFTFDKEMKKTHKM